MVDEDDVEKRADYLPQAFQLADQNKAPDLPPAQPAQPQLASDATTDDRSYTPGRKWYRYDGSLRDILCVSLAVFILVWQAYLVYDYLVGTPTTMRVDHCDVTRGNWYTWWTTSSCRGTWSLGGQSQTGKIEPPFQAPFWSRSVGPGEGSSLHVRVHDRTAVTLSKDLYFNFALFAFLFAACFPRLWKAWRGHNHEYFGELAG
jgi:hypothetical protein